MPTAVHINENAFYAFVLHDILPWEQCNYGESISYKNSNDSSFHLLRLARKVMNVTLNVSLSPRTYEYLPTPDNHGLGFPEKNLYFMIILGFFYACTTS